LLPPTRSATPYRGATTNPPAAGPAELAMTTVSAQPQRASQAGRGVGELPGTQGKGLTLMAKQNRTGTGAAQGRTMKSAAAPSENTERPDGLAFDVEPGTDLPGVPVGDQTPSNPDAARTEEVVRESGDGVGLAVPREPARNQRSPPRTQTATADPLIPHQGLFLDGHTSDAARN
jgi:hypothetical protein